MQIASLTIETKVNLSVVLGILGSLGALYSYLQNRRLQKLRVYDQIIAECFWILRKYYHKSEPDNAYTSRLNFYQIPVEIPESKNKPLPKSGFLDKQMEGKLLKVMECIQRNYSVFPSKIQNQWLEVDRFWQKYFDVSKANVEEEKMIIDLILEVKMNHEHLLYSSINRLWSKLLSTKRSH